MRISTGFPGRLQQGAAVVTAILVVALAATTATWLLQRMDRWIERVALTREKSQSMALSHAALDYCRLVLGADARRSAVDALDEDWARILPPLRQGEHEIQGRISDLQGRLNLNNLILAGGAVDQGALTAYRRLLATLGLPERLADDLLEALASNTDQQAKFSPDAPARTIRRLMLWGDLAAIPGYAGEAMQKLSPHAAVLPGAQPINVNTASAELLAAILPSLDLASARGLVNQRRGVPFRDVAEFHGRLAGRSPEASTRAALVELTTLSQYFLARIEIVSPHSRTTLQGLLQRQPHQMQPRILWMFSQ